ncbi:hypothetical protein [Desulfosporosinus nitroreducens]|uniref:Uncharacterized protein n=1 Tax=Desulfosporosinus nitroreducens TaxID=2018668 RepID=A0ABT8QVY8_9FIRM|nr:hypothetical protein [Desulfosporosinus nitroreducens]MCO1602189.1 hypothetical protein [Desulfosporosinus nitroreducens]MDO0825032.1 hypothetical protein [Desulfosporosinus nitroreducens]
MKIPMIILLLQGIPEGTALTALAFVISRIPLKLKQILLVGTALAVCVNIIRLFSIPMGLHTILATLILFLILTRLSKGDVGLSFIASMLSCLTLIIFETACLPLLKPVSILAPKTLSTYHAVRIILGDIHVLLLFISAFLLKKIISNKS